MSPPPTLLPILQKMKTSYALWFSYYTKLPKLHRYTLGIKLDTLLIETIEYITTATFTPKQEKIPYVRVGIRKLDTFKMLLLILWETKSMETKQYAALSVQIQEIGKMLGGWHGQLLKQNSSRLEPEEK